LAEQPSQPGSGREPIKPPFLVQAAKALSQLGLTFYVLLLILALMATAGRSPAVAVLMAVCAVVPLVFGPRLYRAIGLVALMIAGGFYLTAEPQPQRPGTVVPQKAPAAATPSPPAAAPEQSKR
jgi:hypothetical protein